MPNLRQLRALALLERTLSFTHTAVQMAVTQSAVSVMIRDLELEVGTPVVVRGRQLRLTAAGAALARCAARSLDDIERTIEDLRSGSDLRRGRLRVAAAHVSAAVLLPPAIAALRERHPQLTVELVDCPVERVSRLVGTGDADAGVGALDADPSTTELLAAQLLLRDRLWAVRCGAGGYAAAGGSAVSRAPAPRARAATLGWPRLADQPLILVGRVQGQWRDLFLRLTQAGLRFRVAHEVAHFATALEMVRHRLGTALLPGFVAATLDRGAFDARPLAQPVTDWHVQWLTRRDAGEMPAAAAMHRALLEVIRTRSRDGGALAAPRPAAALSAAPSGSRRPAAPTRR